jgi:hypothetical protein
MRTQCTPEEEFDQRIQGLIPYLAFICEQQQFKKDGGIPGSLLFFSSSSRFEVARYLVKHPPLIFWRHVGVTEGCIG